VWSEGSRGKQRKDRGRVDIEHIGPTEDAAMRRPLGRSPEAADDELRPRVQTRGGMESAI